MSGLRSSRTCRPLPRWSGPEIWRSVHPGVILGSRAFQRAPTCGPRCPSSWDSSIDLVLFNIDMYHKIDNFPVRLRPGGGIMHFDPLWQQLARDTTAAFTWRNVCLHVAYLYTALWMSFWILWIIQDHISLLTTNAVYLRGKTSPEECMCSAPYSNTILKLYEEFAERGLSVRYYCACP